MSLIADIVRLHRAQVFGVVEIRGVGRLRKIYAEAQAELDDRLRRLARAGKGQTFTAHHLRLVLAQVADTIRGFDGPFFDHVRGTGEIAGNLAPRHLTATIGTLEEKFGRLTPVIQSEMAAVVRGAYPSVAPSLLDAYRSSSRLYGPQAIVAIRQGLAGSIVRAEGADEAIDRVAGSSGLFAGQRWRAERIVRTETAYGYGVTNQRAMEQLRPVVPRMMKRLVATFDDRIGDDSKLLNGQTVPVDQPFIWEVTDSKGHKTGKVVRYMQPPNRPNDREVVIPWMAAWGAGGLAEPGPVDPTTRGVPGA